MESSKASWLPRKGAKTWFFSGISQMFCFNSSFLGSLFLFYPFSKAGSCSLGKGKRLIEKLDKNIPPLPRPFPQPDLDTSG